MKQIGPAILAAQPIVGRRRVEDRRRGGFGETGDRQEFCRGEIRYDQADVSRREVAKGGGDVAVLGYDTFDQFEGLAGEVPCRVVIGDTEPRALYSLVLGGLIEVRQRYGPFDRLRQPADL